MTNTVPVAPWQPIAATLLVIGMGTVLAIPALNSAAPQRRKAELPAFSLPTQASKGHPIPVAPPGRPMTMELDCNRGGDGIFLSGGPICIYSNSWPSSASWTGEILSSHRRRPLLRLVEGARVQIHLETLAAPLVAISDRWGQFSFVNMPVRRQKPTCGSQSVDSPNYGDYLEKKVVLYRGRFGQTIELLRRDTVSNFTYKLPKRCLRYKSPLTLDSP